MLTHATTPIAIRSHTKLEDSFERRIRAQLARRIGPAVVERATVRFEDTNGPKGGIDTICRISLVVATRPTIIVAKIATSVHLAFAQAVHAIGTALSRTKQKTRARRTSRVRASSRREARGEVVEDESGLVA